jgi:hypothetical protein
MVQGVLERIWNELLPDENETNSCGERVVCEIKIFEKNQTMSEATPLIFPHRWYTTGRLIRSVYPLLPSIWLYLFHVF